MAATDQTYRHQKMLDIVFAVSCVLMLASIIWMFADDYNREFKRIQRQFRDVDDALTERSMLEKLPDPEAVEALQKAVVLARRELQLVKDEIAPKMRPLLRAKADREATAQRIKADADSLTSLYDIAVEARDEAGPNAPNRAALEAAVERRRQQVAAKNEQLAAAQKKLEDTDTEIARLQKTDQELLVPGQEQTRLLSQKKAEAELSKAEDRMKKTAGDFDRFAKATAQKRWKLGDSIRNLVILDAFASPTRIQQYTLDQYPIDYNFKYVTRYDRCTTCHLGMENPNFTKEALRSLAEAPEGGQEKLRQAHALLADQVQAGEKLGFDPGDVPTTVRTVNLSPAQINEYCAHPRLDVFVDANSPHPAEKFGCTSCHSGQGSATEFVLASHTPNSSEQEEEWRKEHHWAANHFWDYPMLPKRFVESTCLKCHHQVTDLVRYGSKEEAPKLMHGHNLVSENGCFGCHEIAGIKNGREVGPDLRLEPSPPLEAYTPGERAKILADPENPPGTMRKVGPSLYRITEKTNQQWARRWIQGPRDFRPTTKMPHFYGLSNNRDDVLPPDQKGFPEAEIHSLAHYLFTESQDYLKGEDKYRRAIEARIKELKEKKDTSEIAEGERKQLEELTRRLELDRPPVPIARGIHDSQGQPVQLPPAPKDKKTQDEQLTRGRQLFTERGCLACHQHQGTTQDAPGAPAVAGEADFAPNLSRVAAKIAPVNGDAEARRRWLVQWILDPHVHHPRSRMPVTHLDVNQAADVAAWLLAQGTPGWDAEQDVPAPSHETLAKLARVYLLKAPGMTREYVDGILQPVDDNTRRGLTDVKDLPLDADERELATPLDDNKLKWYIGRKAITRLGCFGCHEIPGFATAKPIGTPLNDWGKKDPERLAFEDIVAYVKEHYRPVASLGEEKSPETGAENGHMPPFESYFLEALEHHTRDGFLYQKLEEPRSYDFNRERTWDDRLRMPQFRFAHGPARPREGESEEQAAAREEAEAREAVMTFILGLVAEPVPAAYLYEPTPDRRAEVRGRQVLEKYNCAGCHQIRPGVYELAKSPAVIEELEKIHRRATSPNDALWPGDYRTRDFLEHNAWTGVPSPHPDRLLLYGIPAPTPPDAEPGQQFVRLTQALRFGKDEKQLLDIPAATVADFPNKDAIAQTEPFGGTFANLMVRSHYLSKRDGQKYTALPSGESPDARAALPPPLLREGEKTQPAWLAQFLRNPFAIRPLTVLRMPRFNMSDDEAMDLVNYFAAADKLGNPGIGLNYPYLGPVAQRQETFWQEKSHEYVAKLQKDKVEQKRIEVLRPLWDELLNAQTAEAEAAVKAARDAEAKTQAEARLKALKDQAAFVKNQQTQWSEKDAYAADAYRLLASNDRCLNCHQVGPLAPKQAIGPPLDLGPERLRPDWMLRWIGSPQRLLIFPDGNHPMPTNFKSNDAPWPEFDGSMLEQTTAVRDVLIDYPKVANLPTNRVYRPTSGGK